MRDPIVIRGPAPGNVAAMEIWLHWMVGIAIIAPALVVVEHLNPEMPPKRIRTEQRTDCAYLALQALWLPICALIVSAFVGVLASRPMLPIGDLSHIYAVQAAGAFIVAESCAYWIHRTEHVVPALWRVHAAHHASRDVNWMTTFRFHPADAAIQQIAPPLCAVVIGFPEGTLAPDLLLVGVVTLFAHCNVSRGPVWLDRIIVTPGYHRSHHEQLRADTNFALTMPMMDIIFKTASFERGERRFGTTASVPERGMWSQVRWGLGLSKQQQAQ